MNAPVLYADANAGLPASPRHLKRVFELLCAADGNPSSMHSRGRKARIALETARQHICRYLKIAPEQFVFTSGGTESNNLVMRSVVAQSVHDNPHIVISAGDHHSITNTADDLCRDRCTSSVIPLDSDGFLRVSELPVLITKNTVLVCLTHANSETGVINDVSAVAERIKELHPDVHVHCDAVQALGKLDVRGYFPSSAIDSVSFSAHKLGALKGCGGLYLRDRHKLTPHITGGSQEQNLRAGTENLAGIVSFGMVVDALPQKLEVWRRHVNTLRTEFEAGLTTIPQAVVHGNHAQRLPNTVNFHIDGVKGEDLILALDLAGFAVSSGSACASGLGRASHVLRAMGYSDAVSANTVRVSFTDQGEVADVRHLAKTIADVAQRSNVP